MVRLLVPVVLGGVASIGHEGWGLGPWPVWIAFACAVLMVPRARGSAGWFGWLMGLGYFAVTLRWIVEPFLVDLARHGWMAPFAIVLMAGGLALFWALAFWAARYVAGPRAVVMLWLPFTLCAAELLRAHIFTGFPWGLVSYTLIGGASDIWLAWVGPHGTGLLLVGVAGVAAYCLHCGWTLLWPGLVGVMLATLGLAAVSDMPMPVTDQTVRIIQPNAPQHQKWDPEWMPVFFDRAIDLTADGPPADVVVWPETSVPTLLSYADPWFAQMSMAAAGAPVVAGIQRRDGRDYYNALVVLGGPTEVSALYDKSHLVPFGEYVPMADLLRPLGLGPLVDQVAGFTPGTGPGLVQIDGLGLTRVLICYEGIFPQDMQRGERRPEMLLIITNDAWFGNDAGPRQHLQQARARAIEQGLPLVRSANTGISAVIDARGRILASLPLNEAGALDAVVPAALPATLYARTGDVPLMVLLGVAILGGGLLRRRIAVDDPRAQA